MRSNVLYIGLHLIEHGKMSVYRARCRQLRLARRLTRERTRTSRRLKKKFSRR